MSAAFSGEGPQKSYTSQNTATTVDLLTISQRQREIVDGLVDKAIKDPEYAKGPIHQVLMAIAEGLGKIKYDDYMHEAGSPEFDDVNTLALKRDIEDYVLSSLLFKAVQNNEPGANARDKNIRPYLELAQNAAIRLGDNVKELAGDSFSPPLSALMDYIEAEIQKEPTKALT